MYIIQNASKNIGRNKGRNILMGVIIFAIIATSAIALIINNTANGIIDDYRERFGSEVRINPDFERIREEAMRAIGDGGIGGMMRGGRGNFRLAAPAIPPEQLIAFSNSQYLRETVFEASVGVHGAGYISPIDEDVELEVGAMGGMMIRQAGIGDAVSAIGANLFSANLMGYNHAPEDFTDGLRQLAEGRFPEADGEAIISRDLLENSGLSIGDTIRLASTLMEASPDPDIPHEEWESYDISYTLTIVGYFDDMTDEYPIAFVQHAFMNRRNEIITTVDTVIAGMRDGFTGIRLSATYYLRSPDMLAAFEAEVRAKGLEDTFLVSTDEEAYNTIVQPVEGLRSVTFVFLTVVLALGAVILMLLSTIAIRERKYEIGVLRAMGMKKSRVALGLLSEMVMITLVCLVVGLGAGAVIAQPVSDMLLDNQLQQIEAEPQSEMFGGMGRGIRIAGGGMMRSFMGNDTQAEALQSMDVSMSAASIGQIILVSLMLALISSIAGIAHVTKYEPIKILSERT